MTCEDNCFEFEFCNYMCEMGAGIDYKINPHNCKYFKDKSRFVELPCKTGDTVYHTTTFGIGQLTVAGIHLFWDKRETRIKRHSYLVGLNNLNYTYRLPLKEIGKTVFFTKEEAKAKLKELNKK